MSDILKEKLEKLENSNDYECWYLVKQPTDFGAICYLVSILEEYKENKIDRSKINLSDYVDKRVEEINSQLKTSQISKNYRALRIAIFFGLIQMIDSKYESAVFTDTYRQIKKRTNGDFERKSLYEDIITRQIEKMYVSSSIDEEFEGVRKRFRLYPIILLYKVLLELGLSQKSNYSITMNEYRYLVATTETYKDYLDTILQIIELRNNPEFNTEFEKYRSKFDNRMIQAIKQLGTLEVSDTEISVKKDKVDEVIQKVSAFEKSNIEDLEYKYIEFLGSTMSLMDLINYDDTVSTQQNLEEIRERGGQNTLLYGVPGSGKSYTISKEYCDDESKIERIVFHPDYMNTDFIGQILPTIKEDKTITYEFTPGPFTRIMKKAYNDPSNMYYLIIEEINRGNAPAIFGDIFQLLDRNTSGSSSYSIKNYNVANEVYGNDDVLISIPSNLSILATMNTADQNVFTLDTAFQRRWIMRLIKNEVSQAEHAKTKILDTGVTWETFNNTVNNFILANNSSTMSSEDKRLGAYFITQDILELDENNLNKYIKGDSDEFHSVFAEKVIKYLWDDAFKFARNKLFDINYRSLEKVIEDFAELKGFDRFNIFTAEVKSQLRANLSEVESETSNQNSESTEED